MFPLLARGADQVCELRRAVHRLRAPAAESALTLARTAVDPRVNAEKRDRTPRQGDSVGSLSLRASAGPVPDGYAGSFDQFIIQVEATAAVFAYTAIGTFILLKITDVIVGLRVPEEEEREGLDVTQHGERLA